MVNLKKYFKFFRMMITIKRSTIHVESKISNTKENFLHHDSKAGIADRTRSPYI